MALAMHPDPAPEIAGSDSGSEGLSDASGLEIAIDFAYDATCFHLWDTSLQRTVCGAEIEDAATGSTLAELRLVGLDVCSDCAAIGDSEQLDFIALALS